MSPSKWKLWIGLTRPHTLPTGLAGVLVAIAYTSTLRTVALLPAGLLCLIAISAQIASNIANDLSDYHKGADTTLRKGPIRPLSQGLMSEREVRVALWGTLIMLGASGIALVAMTSWWLIAVGGAIVLGLFAYSAGPFPLSYHGLGDVAVLVFFGWVPVVTSGCVLGLPLSDIILWHLATAIGLASVNVLIVNNYRDVDEDSRTGKRTIIVRMGREFALHLYLSCGLLSILLLYPIYSAWGMIPMVLYGGMMLRGYRSLRNSRGTALNGTLAMTARNVFFLALLICLLLGLKP